MNQRRQDVFRRRVRTGIIVLASFACLSGVAPVAESGGKPPAKPQVEKTLAPPSTDDLLLDPSRERRADALARYAAGYSAEWRRQYAEALAHYRKAAELEPDAVPVHLQMAELLARQNRDVPAAIAQLEQAVQFNPKHVELLVRLGDLYRDANSPDQAAATYRKALALGAQARLAYARLAGLYSAQNNLAQAVSVLDEAMRQPSNDADYWVWLGNYYRVLMQPAAPESRALQLPQKAVACFEKAHALKPTDSLVMLQLAQAHQLNQNLPTAIQFYNEVLKVKPNEYGVRRQLLELYTLTNQKDKALAEWDRLIESLPDSHPGKWEQHFERGKWLAELKQYEKAVEDFERAAKLNPRQPDPRVQLAFGAMNLKQFDRAQQTLENARKDFPNHLAIPHALAVLYSELKDYDKAVAAYEETESLAQQHHINLNAEFYFFYGAACERGGRTDQAALIFEKAIELNPQYAEALNYLGYMWADNGKNLDKALELIQRAVELQPDNAAFLDSLGWVHFKKGNLEEALRWLNQAESKLEKPEAEIFDHLAEVHDRLGKRADAIRYWKKALEAEPANEKIKNKLQRALGDSGQKQTEKTP